MNQKRLFSSASFWGQASLGLVLLMTAQPAWAGFQWIAPEKAADYEAAPVAPPAAAALDMPSPQIIEAPAPVLAPAPSAKMASPKATGIVPAGTEIGTLSLPVRPEAPALAPAPVVAPMAEAPVAPSATQIDPDQKIVKGFAKEIPLAVALRQVLPAEKGFAVDPDINIGTLVSWRGGKPWRDVLTEMLKPSGMMIKEQGEVVHVVPAPALISDPAPMGAAAMPPSVAAAPAVMEPAADSKPVYLLPEPKDVPAAPMDRAIAARAEPASKAPVSLVPPAAAPVPSPAPATKSGLASASGFLIPPASAVPPKQLSAAPVSSFASDAVVDSWSANKGDLLRKVLENWCRRANVEMAWQAEYDYPLQASVSLGGTFEDAVRGLLGGFEGAKPRPVATLHNNQVAGQTVLVVTTRGNTYED